MKVLIVEDDRTSQLMLKAMLSGHDCNAFDTGEAGLEWAKGETADLVILDINLPGIDGYETCRQLREMSAYQQVPIIFLSQYDSLEDRLKAYGIGGNDYVGKPFDVNEFSRKIETYGGLSKQTSEVQYDLNVSQSMLLEIQNNAAKIQSISRFIQVTLFCHDMDMLLEHFFKTAREIDLACVLKLEIDGQEQLIASDGTVSRLEEEILKMSSTMKRIHTFGADRAVYRWGNVVMLARHVGEMVDTIAMFMDALEAGIHSVGVEQNLLRQVYQVEDQNRIVRDRVYDLFKNMQVELKDAILSLALLSSLDPEEEDRLNDLIDKYGNGIDTELKNLNENNRKTQQLIDELRTPPAELVDLMKLDRTEADDVSFF